MARRAICAIFSLVILICLVSGDSSNEDETEEPTFGIESERTRCCDEGEYKVYDDCKFDADDDVNDTPECKEIAVKCCQNKLDSRRVECETGIQYAKDKKSCSDIEDDHGQQCCNECEFAFNFAGSNNCESSVGATRICCEYKVEESTKSQTTATTPETTVSTTPMTPEDDLDGCELQGGEICAHKCISMGKSYKCSCKTGFKLRADGFSCQKLLSDRCKKKNPCMHKCADLGEGIICSCHKGYELMSDNVSCIDINECDLQTHNCGSDKKCVNIPGSYRCTRRDKAVPKDTNCPKGFKLNETHQVCDDVNECLEKPNSCPPGKTCINTIGSFTCRAGGIANYPTNFQSEPVEEKCPEGYRYLAEKADCVDIDECQEKKDDCNPNGQVCLNMPGSWFCQNKVSKITCPPGYKMIPGTGCQDIDECQEDAKTCLEDEICENYIGSYNCKRREGNRDPSSSSDPISPNVFPSKPNRRRPTSCPRGYKRSSTGGCEDIDECLENIHSCDEHQECLNTMGGHRCTCRRGFKRDPVTRACIDVNECQRKELNNCEEAQRCDNTVGSYHCVRIISCGTGYTLNAGSNICEDDDECALNTHNCDIMGPMYECVNVRGSYKCIKKKIATTTTTPEPEYYYYYEDDNVTVSEAVPDPTPSLDTRYEVSGSSRPASSTDRQTFATEEPSSEQTDHYGPVTLPLINNNYDRGPPSVLNVPESKLQNLPFDPNTKTTSVIVEPNEKGEVVINTANIPKDTITSLLPVEKHCLFGYEKNSYGECVDTDECATGKYSCTTPSEICKNTLGGYICECAPDYIKDERTSICRKLEKVTERVHIYELRPPVPAVPRWSPRPRPDCNNGYELDPNTNECVDIDECAQEKKCANEEICVNTLGGYRCQCKEGLHLIQGRCVPIHSTPFTAPPRQPSRVPSYTKVISVTRPTVIRSYCPNGYYAQNNNCVDIDECTLKIHSCFPNQECINKEGGYMCRCPPGHVPSKGVGIVECEDIDECEISAGKACPHYSTCINTVGSYKCQCKSGFVNHPQSQILCVDKDECVGNNGKGDCHHKCINVWGSYRCDCDRGYMLNPDNRTCVDINECALGGRRLCSGVCKNIPGGYQCTCPSGYTLSKDGKNCNDIDECDDGQMVCGPEEVCQNIRGGARCNSIACPPGYTKEPHSKHRCRLIRKDCFFGNPECKKRPDTYSFNFVTFASKLPIRNGQVDLFTMRGPTWPDAILRFEMKLMEVNSGPGVERATIDCFRMAPSPQQASIYLVKSLIGPQDIHLELVMELYHRGTYEGTAVAKLFIHVSQYDF